MFSSTRRVGMFIERMIAQFGCDPGRGRMLVVGWFFYKHVMPLASIACSLFQAFIPLLFQFLTSSIYRYQNNIAKANHLIKWQTNLQTATSPTRKMQKMTSFIPNTTTLKKKSTPTSNCPRCRAIFYRVVCKSYIQHQSGNPKNSLILLKLFLRIPQTRFFFFRRQQHKHRK